MRLTVIAALAIATAAPAAAQTAPTPPPNPCETDPKFAEFDFWLGAWDVANAANDQPAGVNKITKIEGDCLILEEWTSVSGNTGQSYNYYNPVTEEWRQLWISQGSIIDYVGGLTDSGSMLLEGEIFYHAGPAAGQEAGIPFTGEWTLQEDGSVIQHFKQYDAETDAWNDWFVGRYRRKDS